MGGRPSVGDLAVNVALGATLLWLPLSIASIGRFAWVNYKITDKRISVTNTSPVGNEDEKQLECPMEDIQDVSEIEIRSIDKWQEIRDFILSKVEALREDDVQ